MAPLLKRLEKQGLVNRIRPETNERKLYITLTKHGEQLKNRAVSVPDVMRGCLNLSQEEMEQLKTLLPDESSMLFTGKDICSYMEAFASLGYKPEQVTKILLTHKHADHSGELKSFPNAKIYVNEDEISADELQGLPNLVPVKFTDGAYYNFPESQKIRDGITFIKAKGHTNGNSIVIVELDGLFYMIHGDITYVDEALYENKISVVFDDIKASRETLDRVREFIRNHPTVYIGTHTPQGYENLEAKRVMDLDNPVPTVLAEVDFSKSEGTGKYVCSVCGYVYDPTEHDGVAFEDLPADWTCPRCKQPKEKFNKA